MVLKKFFKWIKRDHTEDDIKIRFSLSGLRGRILMIVMIPLIFLISVSGLSLFQMKKLSSSMATTLNDTVPVVVISKQIQQELIRVQTYLLLASLSKTNEDELIDYLETADDAVERFGLASENFKKLSVDADVATMRTSLITTWSNVSAGVNETKMELKEKKFKEAQEHIQEKVKPDLKLMMDTIKDIVAYNEVLMDTAKTEGAELSKTSQRYALFGAFFAAVFSLTVSFLFATSISKKFARIGENLSQNADQMTATATQIASAAQQLSEASTEQAASLQETSSAIEETSSMVRKNSDNSKNAAISSATSLQKAQMGKQVVENMITSMDNINESNNKIVAQFNDSNQKIGEIVELIQVIGKKTKVINEIVFQTKLLSFNASVEAARAGEHGKGFAVVAEEVGNLAQMSGNAAKEITDLLNDSTKKVESIVNESKSRIETLVAEGKETVQVGTQVAKECSEVLGEIIGNVSQVSSLVEEISSASKEQSDGVHEITKAIMELGQTTQQNAASSADSASGARDLEGQAEVLRTAIVQLVATIQGST